MHRRVYAKGPPQALESSAVRHGPAAQHTIRLLYAFSGPEGKPDWFAAWAKAIAATLGAQATVDELDTLNGHDLAEETVWETVKRDIGTEGGYDGALWPPPGSTSSNARSDAGGGP